MIMTVLEAINYTDQQLWLLITTCVLTTFYLGGIVYLYCKFSGIPYIDTQWRKKQKKVLKVFLYWVFALYLNGAPAILTSTPDGNYLEDMTVALVIVTANILFVIIPILLALD